MQNVGGINCIKTVTFKHVTRLEKILTKDLPKKESLNTTHLKQNDIFISVNIARYGG